MENLVECLGPAFEFCNVTGMSATIAHQANSFFCLEHNWHSLEEATEKLKDVNKSVTIKVIDELNKLNECNHEVERWLKKAIIETQNNGFEDEYNRLERCGLVCNCTPNLPERYHLGKQTIEKLECVRDLIKEGKQFSTFGHKPPPDKILPRQLKTPIGMERILQRLDDYFNDKERSIIGVWGQGGVGKTTLLNAFNNNLKYLSATANNNPKDQTGVFQVVIAIDVSNSETLDVAGIQRMITDRIGLPWIDTDTEVARAKTIIKALSRKRFVILLDDVWKKFCLEDVGIPTPNTVNGCKIVLASRDQNVCIQMDAQKSLVGMQILDENASWELFKSNLLEDAFASVCANASIETCARSISERCGGLPLALNVIGKTVAGFSSLRDWEDAERAIIANMGYFEGVTDEMFPRLRYSYDKLDALIKQCFLYCTLFPEYTSIKRDQLVEYWVAEGFIPQNEPWKGPIIINKLLSVCLLLQSTSSEQDLRLHNVIRNLGLWIAHKENNFLVQSGHGLENPPENERWQGPKRISLMSNNIRDISTSPNCDNLETLLLQNNRNLRNLHPNFFESMSNLKVLDLSKTGIRELPECDALVQLQYLNLSRTPIKKLPERLWVLQQLRHLDLSVTKDLEKTFDNCSKLLKLRVLNLFRSHYGIELVDDLNLDTLKQLSYLGIAIHAEDVLRKLKKTDLLAKSTHWLSVKDCHVMQSIHVADFNHMEHLEELYIEFCKSLNELVVDQDETRVSHLKVLTLWKLPSLETILVKPLPHRFTKLRQLTINDCPKLNHISWVINLELLEKLVISRCKGMRQIVTEMPNGTHEDNYVEFPKLTSIVLSELEELVSICNARDFLCLESIRVQNCPKLKKLPIARDSKITKLRQICGSSEWWQGLNWEDQKMGEALEDFFIPFSMNGSH